MLFEASKLKKNLTSQDLQTSRTKQTIYGAFSGEEFKNTSSLSCGEFGVSIKNVSIQIIRVFHALSQFL